MVKLFFPFLILGSLLCSLSCFANGRTGTLRTNVIYVDKSARTGGSGTTPSRAFKYLQDALDLAENTSGLTEIRVAQGTYYPDEGDNVTNGDQDAFFRMQNSLSILGGYPTGFPIIKGRNWNTNPTILSGDINQNGSNLSKNIIRNDYQSGTPLASTAILEGFTLEQSLGLPQYGGAIYNKYSSPTIRACIFKQNRARIGGAVANEHSSPIFENCLFYDNYADFGGNTIYNFSSVLTLINCTITENIQPSQTNTESIRSGLSNIIATNCIFWGNDTEFADIPTQGNRYLVAYSIIEGGLSGTQNVDSDPLFYDAPADDFRIQQCSPALNSGDNTESTTNLDLSVNNRIRFTTVDRGAYEYISSRVYVNASASGNDNGRNWNDAYVYLGNAIAEYETCGGVGEIWVAQGTYTTYSGGVTGSLTNFKDAHFKLLPDVKLFGGFQGNETSSSQRNYELYETVLSADTQQNDATGDLNDNTYHVFYNNYPSSEPLTNSAVLDGFTISSGNAIDLGSTSTLANKSEGGGMYNNNASPLVRNCKFTDNIARGGGGIFNTNSDVNISNCSFTNNTSARLGAAVVVSMGTIDISNCEFSNNYAEYSTILFLDGSGGALSISTTTGSVSNCTFTNNRSDTRGGAVVISAGSNTDFTDCTFTNNTSENGGAVHIATGVSNPLVGNTNFLRCNFSGNVSDFDFQTIVATNFGGAINGLSGTISIDECNFNNNSSENNGGAIYFFEGSSSVTNSSFEGNSVFNDDGDPNGFLISGGAVFIDSLADVTLNKNLFKNNTARDAGGAIYAKGGQAEIVNSVFVDNEAILGFGAAFATEKTVVNITNCTFGDVVRQPSFSTIVSAREARLKIFNSIVWTNNRSSEILVATGAITDAVNSIIRGGFSSAINLLTDEPKFQDPANYDFSLQRCSPAIDYGNNSFITSTEDFEDNSRIYLAQGSTSGIVDLGAYEYQGSFQTNCDCLPDIILNAPLNSTVLRSSESITASSVINNDEKVTLGANNSILLSPPFETGNNVVFKTELQGCVE